jgi:hypothetical protein
MKNVLILNHPFEKCGMYQFGVRVFNLAARSEKVNYSYRIINDREDYHLALYETKPDFIIYNYHWDRMPWLREDDIINNSTTQHYFIYHDGSMFNRYDKYLMFGDYSPEGNDIPENKKVILPRPLYDYCGKYKKNKIITIGSFGFAFMNKGFPELVKMVNTTFQKAIINIHLTQAYFGDLPGHKLLDVLASCERNNTNPNVKLNLTTDFIDNTAILTFLAGNDINILNYNIYKIPSLSSAADYLLSVKRPIAITNHSIFRHIVQNSILLEEHSIQDILDRGTAPLQEYYDKWSTEKFTQELENLFV